MNTANMAEIYWLFALVQPAGSWSYYWNSSLRWLWQWLILTLSNS